MIIFRRPAHPDDHLQEDGPSGWSFARGQSFWMIICKRPVHPDDHLKETSPSGWSFAIGRSIWMIICKRPVFLDNHLQEAGPSRWSFTTMKRAWKMHFWDHSQWDKMCFECHRIKFQWKKGSKFSHLLTVRAKGAVAPPPPYGQPDREISVFLRLP